MSSKRQLILKTAKELFVEQGISGTTIASIANHAGIAKGSVYSYFDSKLEIINALLIESLEDSVAISQELLETTDLSGKALIAAHVTSEFKQVLSERAFQQSIFNDGSVTMNDDIMAIVNRARTQYHQGQQLVLQKAYGDRVCAWQEDIITILKGIIQEYSTYLLIDNIDFSIEHCSTMIAHSIDGIVESLINSELTPVLRADMIPNLAEDGDSQRIDRAGVVLEEIRVIASEMPAEKQKVIGETIDLIQAELSNVEPNLTLIRALIANLAPYSELAVKRSLLADLIDVELIN